MTTSWSEYWQNNQTANSFVCEYNFAEGPYGVVNAYWQSVFKKFTINDTILDIGAGNGALAKLFLDFFPHNQMPQWISSDIAKVKPSLNHPNLEFRQISAEDTKLESLSVSHCISMFGIEYSVLPLAINEVSRILAPNGHCHFIMHHPKSVISFQSKITLEVLKRFTSDSFWTNTYYLSRFTYNELKNACLYNLKDHLEKVNQAEKKDVQLIGNHVFQIMQLNQDVSLLVKDLHKMVIGFFAQIQRLQDQLNSASQAKEVLSNLDKLNFSRCELKNLEYNQSIIGYELFLRQNSRPQ